MAPASRQKVKVGGVIKALIQQNKDIQLIQGKWSEVSIPQEEKVSKLKRRNSTEETATD